MAHTVKEKIWIDLDNSPHVPFFHPLVRELEGRGHAVLITARDRFQVCELADQFGMRYVTIGGRYGKNKIVKVFWLAVRALQMLPLALRERPTLALSHGSRSQVLISKVLRIPSIGLFDYEYSKGLPFVHPTWGLMPDVIPDSAAKDLSMPLLKYPGIKEDVYVPSFTPHDGILADLALDPAHVIVTVRPPATEAHYFCVESQALFESAMDYLCDVEDTQLVLLPRSPEQRQFVASRWAPHVDRGKVVIPDRAVNGLNLIWHSDLVISGGGTMNREAAALGVPVYSIFRGRTGAVDRYLEEHGRLIMITHAAELKSKMRLERRPKGTRPGGGGNHTLESVVAIIESIPRRR
jgi:hypothetical protein